MHDLRTIRKINAPVTLRNAHLAAVNLPQARAKGTNDCISTETLISTEKLEKTGLISL